MAHHAGKKFLCPAMHEDCCFSQQRSCFISQEHSPSHPTHFVLSKMLPRTHHVAAAALPSHTPIALPTQSKWNPAWSVKRLFAVLFHPAPQVWWAPALTIDYLEFSPKPSLSAHTIWSFSTAVHQTRFQTGSSTLHQGDSVLWSLFRSQSW